MCTFKPVKNQRSYFWFWSILYRHHFNPGMNKSYCAAEAIFCCPTENSRHLEAYLVSKDPLFKKEKESARRTARYHITSEKSSKNYIRCFNEPSQAAIQGFPPPPHRKLRRRIFHVVERNVRVAGAVFTHQIYSQDGGGKAG